MRTTSRRRTARAPRPWRPRPRPSGPAPRRRPRSRRRLLPSRPWGQVCCGSRIGWSWSWPPGVAAASPAAGLVSGPGGRRAEVVSRRGTTGRARMFNPLYTFLAGLRGGGRRTTIRRWPVMPGPATGALLMGIPAPAGGEAGQGGTGHAGAGLTGAARDDAVLTALYRQYRGPLLLFVLRLTAGDRHQAEDIVQETMVRAWREARRLDLSEPSLMPWLATVARRIVIDEHRRKRTRPVEIGGAEVVDKAPAAADGTENLLRKVLVAEALQELSPAHRDVLNETILRTGPVTGRPE